MSDLQEIRRFWPKATWWGKNMHAAANGLRGLLWIERVKVGLHRVVYVPENWGRKDFDGPTIAAAMAAAGFGERKWTGYREKRPWWHQAREAHRLETGEVIDKQPLQSRQRPRKGVRLGKAKRLGRAAAELSIVLRLWDLGEQWRLDRGEIGQ